MQQGFEWLRKFPSDGFFSCVEEIGVNAFLRGKLFVRALLYDMSTGKNEYLIGVPHGFQTMCNHNNSLIVRKRADRLLQLRFIFGIDARRRLVEDNDRRVLEHGAGNGNTLLFSARKRRTSFAHLRIITVGESRDKFVAAGGFSGGDDFFVRGVGFSEFDIVFDRVVEQIHVLEHHRNIFHKAVELIIPDIFAADFDRAFLYVPKTGDKIAHRGFATARRPDDRSRRLCGDCQTDVIQNFIVSVREGYVLKRNGAVLCYNVLSVRVHNGRFVYFIGFIHRSVQHLKHGTHIAAVFQFLEYHKGGDKEQKAIGEGERGIGEIKDHGQCGDGNRKYPYGKLLQRLPRHDGIFKRERLSAAVVNGFLYGLVIVLFKPVRFDDAHTLNVLQHALDQRFLCFLPRGACLFRLPLRDLRDDEIKGDSRESKERDAPIGKEHHDYYCEGAEQPAENKDKAARRRIFHVGKGGGDDCGNVAEAVFVEIAHGDITQPVADMDAFVRDHKESRFRFAVIGKIHGRRFAENGKQHNAERDPHGSHGSISVDYGGENNHEREELQSRKQRAYERENNGTGKILAAFSGKCKNFS